MTRTHVWVDAAWWRPGDGSRERPLRSLAEALTRPGPLTVHLAMGTYTGPFSLPEGVRLEGQGPTSVLDVEGAEPLVLRAGQGAELADLLVQGGSWGLEVTGGGRVRLERVGFRGQRTGAVRVVAGRLEAEGARFDAAVSETTGVLLEGAFEEAEAGQAGPGRVPQEVGAPLQRAPQDVGSPFPPDEAAPATNGAGRVGQESAPREAATRTSAQGAPGLSTQAAGAAPSQPVVPSEGPTARITGSSFTGPFRRAVRVRGVNARVELEDVRFSGPVSAVGVDGGHAEVRRAVAEGGRGSAFSVVEGSMLLEHVQVTGHEYGVSSMRARRIDVRDFTSVRAERAGLGLAQSRGVLEGVVVRDSGAFGGIQLVGGDMEVRRFTVEGAAEYGLTALQGKLRVRQGTITRVSSADVAGDGLHLREMEADVEDVRVRDVAGTCVLAAQDSRVQLKDVELVGCRHAGILVETLARVEARNVDVRGGGTALAALDNGRLRVEGLTARQLVDGLVWAECQGDTQVSLKQVRSEDVRGLSAPCVER
ncbi:hypothetical protein [Pyxidicoccus xibeiensis]|uniref:hypothetical protein n=1 Tax=Pyxidicoccus xibeiensis TaxID=2906759 RepID=UPI0020A73024|nr:hypothetical protein [Pyxidicoccus xibeiensis]MCP3138874.1 hypothetical protein [Pyxidicoccus xibeiensis]